MNSTALIICTCIFILVGYVAYKFTGSDRPSPKINTPTSWLNFVSDPDKFRQLSLIQRGFDNIVFFGDSLSDPGNLYAKERGIMPKSPPYYKGRFSNGSVWAERVVEILYPNPTDKVEKSVNYAIGGEVVDLHLGKYLPWDLKESMLSYFYDYTKKNWTWTQSSKTLFILWIGGNDYLNGSGSDIEAYTTSVVNALIKDIEILISYGGKQFLVMNLPDLSKTPYSKEMGNQDNVSVSVVKHNAKLAIAIDKLKTVNPSLKINLFDVTKIFGEILTDISAINKKYGINLQNITEPCWKGGYFFNSTVSGVQSNNKSNNSKLGATLNLRPDLAAAHNTALLYNSDNKSCSEPDTYLYWDHVHPTRVVHKVIGDVISEYILDNF